MLPSQKFTVFSLPNGESAWIPDDIELRIPESSSLSPPDLHFLLYIPWRVKYLDLVEDVYRDFFLAVLPYLHVRTTDVHVATCLPFIRDLIQTSGESVDERAVQIAFMLHDSGWSQMSEIEIAHSLGVPGLSLSGEAVDPKARHAVLGQQIARKLLSEYEFQSPLTDAQKELIYQAILYHDKPWELAGKDGIPASIKMVCNVDHLWSFTHANFWQDTLRKKVSPEAYLDHLRTDLESYFVSDYGKLKARQLLEVRSREVAAWKAWMHSR
jgi:hypothetical protein